MDNTSSLEADGLQQQKTMSVSTLTAKNRKLRLQWAQAHKTGQLKTGKTQLGLMNLNFCGGTQMVGSEFGANNMSPWTQLVNSPGWWRWCNAEGNVILAHFGPVNNNQSLLECHSLSEYLITIRVPSWPQFSLLMATSSMTMHNYLKLVS